MWVQGSQLMNSDQLSKILEIVKSEFNLQATIEEILLFQIEEVKDWDSIGWARIIIRLENDLNVEFDLGQFSDIYTVREFVDVVLRCTQDV